MTLRLLFSKSGTRHQEATAAQNKAAGERCARDSLAAAARGLEVHESVQAPLRSRAAGEAATAGHAPILRDDRPLQPFHEAVGPGVPSLGPGRSQLVTGLIEGALELGPALDQQAAHAPAAPATERDLPQEVSGRLGRARRQHAHHPVRAGGIAGRDLTDLSRALEAEAAHTKVFSRPADMGCLSAPGMTGLLASAFAEQACRAERPAFGNGESLAMGGRPRRTQLSRYRSLLAQGLLSTPFRLTSSHALEPVRT